MEKVVHIYTDGSCNIGNGREQNPGGWAFVVDTAGPEGIVHGSGPISKCVPHTAELAAVRHALKFVSKYVDGDKVVITTDCKQIVNKFEQLRAGDEFEVSDGNEDRLWDQVSELCDAISAGQTWDDITFRHCKRDAHEMLVICDRLANAQSRLQSYGQQWQEKVIKAEHFISKAKQKRRQERNLVGGYVVE